MKLSRLATLACSLLCPVLAHADVLQNFALNTQLQGGASATGNVIFNETSGLFTGGSITGNLNGSTFLFNIFGASGTQGNVTFLLLDQSNGNDFQLVIPGFNNQNYAGGSICLTSGNCPAGGGYYISGFSYGGTTYAAVTGTLVPTDSTPAPTPEPSSVILLGTGLLGMAGAARKRLLAA